jgi:hypothetical protein
MATQNYIFDDKKQLYIYDGLNKELYLMATKTIYLMIKNNCIYIYDGFNKKLFLMATKTIYLMLKKQLYIYIYTYLMV